MDWFAKLTLAAIGFICVAYPVVMLIVAFMMPWYILISYFVWIIVSVLLMKHEKKYAIIVTIVLTVIFTIIFRISIPYSNTGSFFEENILMAYLMPILNLPSIFYIGHKLKKLSEANKHKKKEELRTQAIELYDKLIEEKKKAWDTIYRFQKDYQRIDDFLLLLTETGGNNNLQLQFEEYKGDCFEKVSEKLRQALPVSESEIFPQKAEQIYTYQKLMENEYRYLIIDKSKIINAETISEIKKYIKKTKVNNKQNK